MGNEYILYNAARNCYLVDDETAQTTTNLQNAMIVLGQELAESVKKDFDGFEPKLISRPNPKVPHYIAIVQ